jgi:hypothetical protein
VGRLNQPRFLAPVSGYTRRTIAAIDPLEAVSEDEQARLTRRAHRNAELQLRRQWYEAHEAITAALDGFAVVAPPPLASSIRAVAASRCGSLRACREHCERPAPPPSSWA